MFLIFSRLPSRHAEELISFRCSNCYLYEDHYPTSLFSFTNENVPMLPTFLQRSFPWFLTIHVAFPLLYSHLHKVRNQGFVHWWATVETRLNSGTTQKDQAKPLWDKLKKTSGRQQVKINLQGAPDIRRASSCCTDPRADPSSQLYFIL